MLRVRRSSKLLCQINCALPSTSSYHTHNELRKSFLDYFESKEHEVIKSAPVIPSSDDGSLLFTNAGMNQFKPLILNSKEQRRVANIQKCIRAGGKHNDLDDVGKDLHHQTFFEMMGNWSFNDAFSKYEACEYAWKYLVDVLKIDPSRLYVSFFKGSSSRGIGKDVECEEIWKKIGVPPERILPFGEENFWEMGATGPCGPCTEIHFDRIGNRDASKLVNVDDTVVEIWNIVFMSNLRNQSGNIESLGRNHIDTGMGFERLLSIVQNKNSNFDTDVFTPILDNVSKLTKNKSQYSGSIDFQTLSGRQDCAFRLVSDHIRAITFAISDGVQPDSTGPGFVVRKMLRRIFLNSTNSLGIERFATAELVPVVVDTMKNVYPELYSSSNLIQTTMLDEEKQFWKTVDKAKKVFDRDVKNYDGNLVSGDTAFYLHDTHGLPLSVTIELARHIGKEVDEKEFEKIRQKAQEKSSKSSKFTINASINEFPSFSDKLKYDYKLVGDEYEFPTIESKILALYENDRKVSSASGKCAIILENCQFYAEQGGQASDKGTLNLRGKPVFRVENVRKIGQVTILFGEVLDDLRINEHDKLEQNIDVERRCGLMRAHSATHLLNWALTEVGIGKGQKGSSVDDDYLRFDYSSNDSPNRLESLKNVEKLISGTVSSSECTAIDSMTLEEAGNVENLQGDIKKDIIGSSMVRVVKLGPAIECCAGTHVLNTSSIGKFVILSDKSSSKEVRRIIGVTGEKAKNCISYSEEVLEILKNCKDVKKRKAIGKSIDWKRIPLLRQNEISSLFK